MDEMKPTPSSGLQIYSVDSIKGAGLTASKLSVALLTCCSWQYGFGENPNQDFKPGDYVEIVDNTTRHLCTVSGKYRAESRDYPVSCGTKDLYAAEGESRIRRRKPDADEIRIAAQTATAVGRLPRPGSGPGARYGTREPKTCAYRTEPAAGPPSVEVAKRTFVCDTEGEGVTGLVLVANVRIEIAAGRSFNAATDSGHSAIDPKQTIYDIRGSFTHYDCRKPELGENPVTRTHNCSAFDEPSARGICFKNTFGDWHCTMHDMRADILNPRLHLLPPE